MTCKDTDSDRFINLHIHSTASDGFDSPTSIVEKAFQCGLSAIALTDHDTVSGIEAANHEATKYDIELIPGIELSVGYKPIMHILGLYINTNDEKLNSHIEKISKIRMRLVTKAFSLIKAIDIRVTPQQVIKRYKILSVENLIKTIVDMQIVHCIEDATLIFSDILEKWKDSLPTMEECIGYIHDSGGISILAHPKLLNQDDAQLFKTIQKMKSYDLDGIEIYHPAHDAADRIKYIQWASELNLICSGGSDYHGIGKRSLLRQYDDEQCTPYLYLCKMKKYFQYRRN